MSLEAFVKRAEKDLGLGEPNYIQTWYANRNGNAYRYNFAWCDAAVTKWAYDAGEYQAVCYGTDYALTTAHASRGRKEGDWHYGTSGIRRGDVLFFDWGGSRSIAYIDHVGVVTGTSGGYVYTVEGNTDNACKRRVRTASTIVGYIRPRFGAKDGGFSGSSGGYEAWRDVAAGSRTIRRGNSGSDVKVAQRAVGASADGFFGPNTESKVKSYQERHGLGVDGIVGPQTWGKILESSSGSGGSSEGSGLTVDGQLGPLTAKATQRRLGVTADGVWGPVTVKAMQRRVDAGVDGILGPQTTRAVQRHVGAGVDGIWPSIASVNSSGIVTFNTSVSSETTRQLQSALNAGRF